MTKIAGSGSESRSGSISQRHGSADPDPDPHQNVMDPDTGKNPFIRTVRFIHGLSLLCLLYLHRYSFALNRPLILMVFIFILKTFHRYGPFPLMYNYRSSNIYVSYTVKEVISPILVYISWLKCHLYRILYKFSKCKTNFGF